MLNSTQPLSYRFIGDSCVCFGLIFISNLFKLFNNYFLADICSVISDAVNTFDDIPVNLTDYSKGNLSVLFLADCSTRPRFALFVNPKQTVDGKDIFTIELHVDDDVVTYAPRADQTDWISVNGQLEVQIITEIIPIQDKLKYIF